MLTKGTRRARSRPVQVLALAAALAVMATGCWRSYGYDTANSRSAGSNITPANVATLHEKWRIDGIDGVTSTPAVMDGVVYFGAWDGSVRAVDADDGTPRWTRQ